MFVKKKKQFALCFIDKRYIIVKGIKNLYWPISGQQLIFFSFNEMVK
jgi:hypothetical protein